MAKKQWGYIKRISGELRILWHEGKYCFRSTYEIFSEGNCKIVVDKGSLSIEVKKN